MCLPSFVKLSENTTPAPKAADANNKSVTIKKMRLHVDFLCVSTQLHSFY